MPDFFSLFAPPASGGNIGTELVAKVVADPHMLLVAGNGLVAIKKHAFVEHAREKSARS